MSLPPDYRDSRANYVEVPLLRRYGRQPENEPLLVPTEAPFPIWVVPPGWRMARLSDINQVISTPVPPEQVGELLTQLGVKYQDQVDILGVLGWRGKESVVTWPIQGTDDHIVFWLRGY